MLTRRAVLGGTLAALLSHAAIGHAQPPASDTYTVSLPKQLLALPPFAIESLPKVVSFRAQVTVRSNKETVVYVSTARVPGNAPVVDLDAALGTDKAGSDFCEVSCYIRAGNKFTYSSTLDARRIANADEFEISLRPRGGLSEASGFILHPLSAQLLLGRQYDFKRGGRQTFAIVQDWNGDALNPATEISTLVLQADGRETLTLAAGKVAARRLRYTLTGATEVKGKSGTCWIGPRGELLQSSPPLFSIPFDGGKATGPATQEGDLTILRTTSGETIKGRPGDKSYRVELYGKPAEPFVTALSDSAGFLGSARERWNGRTRIVDVRRYRGGGGLIEYRFPPVKLVTYADDDKGVGLVPLWFATELWEGANGWLPLAPGASRKAVWVPLWLGGDYARPATLTRQPDVARTDEKDAAYRHYRWQLEDGLQYDQYTNGTRLVLLRGSDGLLVVRDDAKEFAAAIAAKAAASETPPKK